MNNAKIALDSVGSPVDRSPFLRHREAELLEIIGALEAISQSEYWKVLEQKIFEGVLEALQRRIRDEKDTTEVFRLQGQLGWAEKYSDLSKLAKVYRDELLKVRTELNRIT